MRRWTYRRSTQQAHPQRTQKGRMLEGRVKCEGPRGRRYTYPTTPEYGLGRGPGKGSLVEILELALLLVGKSKSGKFNQGDATQSQEMSDDSRFSKHEKTREKV